MQRKTTLQPKFTSATNIGFAGLFPYRPWRIDKPQSSNLYTVLSDAQMVFNRSICSKFILKGWKQLYFRTYFLGQLESCSKNEIGTRNPILQGWILRL